MTSERTLALDSAQGEPIDNAQILEISDFEANQFRRIEEKWGNAQEFRSPPTARYNCHGLTFAARRTGIYETETILQILEEDEYDEIKNQNKIMPGDIIIYYSETGDIEHSGIIITPPLTESLGVPKVCSKWGKYAELIHWANQCPYDFSRAKYYRIKVEQSNGN